MDEFVFLVAAPALFLAFIVAYVQRRKRSDLSLWRAVLTFSSLFFGIAGAGIVLMIGAGQMFESDSKYYAAISLFLVFGFLAPAWHLARAKISTDAEVSAMTKSAVTQEPIEGDRKKASIQSVIGGWYAKNGWLAWVATAAIVTMIALIAVEMRRGYDMTPILGLVAFYLTLAVVVGGGTWFFTKIRVGVAIGNAIGRMIKAIVGAAVVLVVATLAIWLGAGLIGAMRDECRQYSDFKCTYLEKATYSVVFGYPRDERTEVIGTVNGLAACGALARSYAISMKMANAPWSYVCCLHAKGSTCYEKHR